MIHYKSHATEQQKVTPTESDLEIIQAFALAGEPIDPADLFIGRMSLANDQYDRSHERFPESYLQQFARTMPGKSVMTGHDYSRDPAGRIFKAAVTPGIGRDGVILGKELVTSYYLLASDLLAAKVRAGIAKDVSIGFNPDLRLCDLCEKDYDGWMKGEDDACPHVAGKAYEDALARVTYGGNVEKVEGLEASYVWLGCQYGAQAIASMRAFAPEAKSAYFDSRGQKGVWALGAAASSSTLNAPVVTGIGDPALLQRFIHTYGDNTVGTVGIPIAAKEFRMPPEIEKGSPPPGELKLSPEQERLIALGKAFIATQQVHVKSRYGAAGQEKTGEVIASTFETASEEQIKAAVAAADEVFNEKFPPKGAGVPASDQPAEVVKGRFNPFRSGVAGGY